MSQEGPNKALTWRSVLIALSFIIFYGWWIQINNLVFDGPKMVEFVPPASALVVLCLLAALSSVLGRWGLSRGELLIIYTMLCLATPFASIGLVHHFLPGLVNGLYLVGVGATKYVPYQLALPDWIRPISTSWELLANGRPMGLYMPEELYGGWFPALDFFQGRSAVPWDAWMIPLAAWTVLFAATFAICLSIATIFRGVWMDHERLAMPLNAIPLSITGTTEGGAIGEIFHNKWMWAGAAFPILLMTLSGLRHLIPQIGSIPMGVDFASLLVEEPWSAMVKLEARFAFYFSPLAIGIAFLLPLEISLSTWVFFLFTRVEFLVADVMGHGDNRGIIRAFGIEWPQFAPYPAAQARGGLLAVALATLWGARRHLLQVWKKVWGQPTDVDDSQESMSYRAATVMGIIAVGVWIAWVSAAGLSIWLSITYLTIMILMILAVSRLRLDAGIPIFIALPIIANFIHIALGTGIFRHQDYAMMAMLNVFSYTMIGSMMLVQMEGFGLAKSGGVSYKQMTWALVLAFVAGLLVAYVFSLQTFYEYGLSDLDTQGGALREARIGRYYEYSYQTAGDLKTPTDVGHMIATGFGFVFTLALTWMRRIFVSWPLHPLGYIFGGGFVDALSKDIWGSMFVGWAAKAMVVKYGGGMLYRKVRPLFIGLIIGEVFMYVLWAIVAAIIGEMGQHLLVWPNQWTWLR